MTDKSNVNTGIVETQYNEEIPWKISDVVFTYVLVFALSILSVGFLIYSGIDTSSALFPAIVQIFLSAFTISIIYLIVTKKYQVSFQKTFGLNVKKFPSYFTQGIAVAFFIVIGTTLVSYAFTELFGAGRENPYSDIPAEKLRVISLLAVFIAPVVEEIFFRGFMQPALTKSLGVFGGIFITALIFGLSHTQYFDYGIALVAVTVIGLILGVTRHYTNSVVPGIFAHLLNNLFAAMNLM